MGRRSRSWRRPRGGGSPSSTSGRSSGRPTSVRLRGRSGPWLNELWSWDITKLLGPAKWAYFYLYGMLDVLSRYVVGWMVAHRESALLAERFIRETWARQEIGREKLTIHADRGPAMTSKPVALLLADLGVTKTHARPRCPPRPTRRIRNASPAACPSRRRVL